jgi:hypothetical protein
MRWLSLPFLLVAGLCAAQPDTTELPNSTHGWHLSPHGSIRVLVLFAEIDWDIDPAKDPAPKDLDHWPTGQLPTWKDDLFDPQPQQPPVAQVSRYYHDISLGQYQVLGDYLDRLITIRQSEHPSVTSAHGIGTLAARVANATGTLTTRHGLGIADFDQWRDGGQPGMPKVNAPDDPHRYDHVMVIVRNSGLTHGQGSTDPGSIGKLFGHESDTQSRFGAMNGLPFEILKHEFNHLLLGGNNFHCGGGNAAQFESYMLSLQGGWSMMGAASSSLLTCNAWDRDRLGWRGPDATYRVNATNVNGAMINGDLDPFAGDTGLFVLRDFVTTGDALRLRMPFLPDNEFPQWLWIENHQAYGRNGSPTDRFHWEATNNPCVEKAEPGLFLLMQIDRDDRYGKTAYSGHADYLHPITASGHFDLEVADDTLKDACPFGGETRTFRRVKPNPLTGSCEQELVLYDRNNDGATERSEHFIPNVLVPLEGTTQKSPRMFGVPDHALRANGKRTLSMGTNPGTSNILTLVSGGKRERNKAMAPDNRTIYLNGLRIHLEEQRADGSIALRVSTGHTRLEEDVVWCADSIVLPPLDGEGGYALTLASGKSLRIDRSLTPTRLEPQGKAKGRTLFAPPSRFTIATGARVLLEANSELRLAGGSVLHLMPGATLALDRQARLHVEHGSTIVVHHTAELKAPNCMLRKLRRNGRLQLEAVSK